MEVSMAISIAKVEASKEVKATRLIRMALTPKTTLVLLTIYCLKKEATKLRPDQYSFHTYMMNHDDKYKGRLIILFAVIKN